MSEPSQLENTDVESGDGLPTMLLVDSDRATRRFLEYSITATKRFSLEVADDCAGALDILSSTVVDLIACSVELRELDGMHLLRRVRREARWANLPFFMLGNKLPTATKVNALQQGADDVIERGTPTAELIARAEGVLTRVREAKERWTDRCYELAGNFRGLAFSDLVSILENGHRSGVLTIMTRRAGGMVHFQNGRIVHATYGSVAGPDAVYRFFGSDASEFEFLPEVELSDVPQTVHGSATGLLLEAARRNDDARRDSDEADGESAGENVKANVSMTRERQAPQVSALLAADIIETLEDPFALGEMLLLTRREAGPWLDAHNESAAVRALLVCDVGVGVVTLGSMASPLSEDQITKGISTTSSALGLAYDLRDGRGLKILLADDERPLELLDGSDEPIDLLIVAPAEGEWVSLSIASRVGLIDMLRRRQPALVVAHGNEGLESALQEAIEQTGIGSELVREADAIDGPGIDFRSVLANSLASWSRAVTGAADSNAADSNDGALNDGALEADEAA